MPPVVVLLARMCTFLTSLSADLHTALRGFLVDCQLQGICEFMWTPQSKFHCLYCQ